MADHPQTSGSVGIEVHGRDNVVISGDVGRDLFVTIGGRNVRGDELAYLDGLVERYRFWAEKYTPLAGIAEVRAAATSGPRLDLPMLFMPAGLEKLVDHGFGEQRRTERVAVDDLRDAVAKYRRLVLLGEPGSGKTTTYQDDLWKSMRGDNLPPLLALSRNPYMLVMLAQVYTPREGVLPQNSGDLFAAFVNTLFAREQKRYDPARWPGVDRIPHSLCNFTLRSV